MNFQFKETVDKSPSKIRTTLKEPRISSIHKIRFENPELTNKYKVYKEVEEIVQQS